MNNGTPYQLEKFADGRFNVLAENGMRAGEIIGGNDHYCAEAGRQTIGWFPNKKLAASAVLEHKGITGLVQQMSSILSNCSIATGAHRRDLLAFDRAYINDWKCATNSLWIIHRAGTSLIHLDLPLSARQALSVIDAFTPGAQQSEWGLYLVDVNSLKVLRLSEAEARKIASERPRYQFDGSKILSYGQAVADLHFKDGSDVLKNKCTVHIRASGEPDKQRVTMLSELGRQYFAIHLRGRYDGIERVTVRQGCNRGQGPVPRDH